MNDFYRTAMGQRFFERTLPDLVKNVGRMADGVERLVKLLEDERAGTKTATKGTPE